MWTNLNMNWRYYRCYGYEFLQLLLAMLSPLMNITLIAAGFTAVAVVGFAKWWSWITADLCVLLSNWQRVAHVVSRPLA